MPRQRQAPPQFLNMLLLTETEVPTAKQYNHGYLVNWGTVYRNGHPFHQVHPVPVSGKCSQLNYSEVYHTYYTNDINALNQLGTQGVDWDFCDNCPSE